MELILVSLLIIFIILSCIFIINKKIFENKIKKLQKSIDQSNLKVQNYKKRISTLNDIKDIAKECINKDWDGYGSEPVKHYSLMKSLRFIDNLPILLEQPEVAIDPDGEIVYDWFGSNGNVLSISFDPLYIIYALSINREKKDHGTIIYHGHEEIPEKS